MRHNTPRITIQWDRREVSIRSELVRTKRIGKWQISFQCQLEITITLYAYDKRWTSHIQWVFWVFVCHNISPLR